MAEITQPSADQLAREEGGGWGCVTQMERLGEQGASEGDIEYPLVRRNDP